MPPTTPATEAPDLDAAETVANFTRLRELSRIAAIDGYRYATEQAARITPAPADLPAHRDAGMWHWVRGYLLDDVQGDDPAGIAARALGIGDALDEMRAAGAL